MKSLLVLSVFLAASFATATDLALSSGPFAVPGSCERQTTGNYCDCKFVGSQPGDSSLTGSVPCQTLSCFHFKNFELDESCVYPPLTATCTLVNPAYTGQCVANELRKPGQTAQEVCDEVLACLSNTGCLKTYCDATQIRTGWELIGVGSDSSN